MEAVRGGVLVGERLGEFQRRARVGKMSEGGEFFQTMWLV